MNIPEGFWDKPSLQEVSLYQAKVPGIPTEVLSQDRHDNCLPRLRAHLRDLESGAETLPDIKLMVLGNGRVGKTQICRRLRGQDYQPDSDSTHGIVIDATDLENPDGSLAARLHLWDFGGQDIYHGTHALFLKTRAVFLLVWSPETEFTGEHQHGGMTFRNFPLAYWLDYVRHLGGPDSPVVIVQTRCDRPEDEALRPPLADEALLRFPLRKLVHYSAANDRGHAALDEALREAITWLRDPQRQGSVQIGAGRLRLKRRLEALRDADAQLPPEQRQHRTLTQAHYRQLCEETGGISSPEHLLDYLHNAGTVFYREGLFDDRIILDQGWALEAIYTVFHREKCYRQLRQLRGRFTRSLLELLAWQDYRAEEQALFLSLMESCGICFVHRREDQRAGTEAEYIAPDLLPGYSDIADELAEHWEAEASEACREFKYPMPHPGLFRGFMARVGREAGINALYWRDGFSVFERTTRCRVLAQYMETEDRRGLIRLRAQGQQAEALIERFAGMLRKEQGHWSQNGEEIVVVHCRASRAPATPATIRTTRDDGGASNVDMGR